MDFGKMKVIDLRAELQARGLDTKGDCLNLVPQKKIFTNFYNNRSQSCANRPFKGSFRR